MGVGTAARKGELLPRQELFFQLLFEQRFSALFRKGSGAAFSCSARFPRVTGESAGFRPEPSSSFPNLNASVNRWPAPRAPNGLPFTEKLFNGVKNLRQKLLEGVNVCIRLRINIDLLP